MVKSPMKQIKLIYTNNLTIRLSPLKLLIFISMERCGCFISVKYWMDKLGSGEEIGLFWRDFA